MKKLFSLLLAMAMMLSCTYFASAEAAPEVDDRNTVLAVVNGIEVIKGDVDDLFDYVVDYFTNNYGYDMSSEENLQAARSLALRSRIQNALVLWYARENGLDQISEEDMLALTQENDAMWEQAIQQYTDYFNPLAEGATEAEVSAARMAAIAYYESQGFTMEGTLQDSIDALVTERVQAAVAGDVDVTDEEIQAHFDELIAKDKEQYGDDISMYEYMTLYLGYQTYYIPEGYRGVTHILLKPDEEIFNTYKELQARYEEQQNEEESEEEGEAGEAETEAEAEETAEPQEPVTEEMVAEARAAVIASLQDTIDEIMAKFNAGTPFEQLIAEYGEDPGMQDESNLKNGYLVHRDSISWDPVFTEAAMSIPAVGGVSEPALGNYGVHIVYYLRDATSELTEDVKAELRDEMLSEKEQDLMNDVIAEWQETAEIEYTDAAAAYQLPEQPEESAEDAPEETAEEPAEETAEEPAAQE